MEARVRHFFAQNRIGTAFYCAQHLGAEETDVIRVMRRLIAAGRLKENEYSQGLYEWQQVGPERSPQRLRVIWRAMTMPHNNPKPFTNKEIAERTGMDPDLIRRYISWLLARGYLVRVGWRTEPHIRRRIYRVSLIAPPPGEAPCGKNTRGRNLCENPE